MSFAESIRLDVRYALRSLAARSNRAMSCVAILTLALGIGAVTAILSIANAALFRPLPYPAAERLVSVRLVMHKSPRRITEGHVADWELYKAWRAGAGVFDDLAAYQQTSPVVTGIGAARIVSAVAVAASMPTLLGIRPILGRTFVSDEDRRGAAATVILSGEFWAQYFGSDRTVLGRSMTVDGRSMQVIGVLPPGVRTPFGSGVDLWLPMGAYLQALRLPPGEAPPVDVLAHLKATVSDEAAEVQLDQITTAIAHSRRTNSGDLGNVALVTQVASLRRILADQVRKPLWLLLGAVSVLLLIACANVANLLLARAVARQREIAVRTALGASRLRIVRQLLTESLVLALLGGALGVLLAFVSMPLLNRLARAYSLDLPHASLDHFVLGVTSAATIVTGIFFGLAPALQLARGVAPASLKDGTHGVGVGSSNRRASAALVVGQVALTLVLLASMGLLARTFVHLVHTNRGYDVDHVLAATMFLPEATYAKPATQLAFAEGVLDRARAIPGVSAAAIATGVPIVIGRSSVVAIPGEPPSRPALRVGSWGVTPDYFRVLGIPLRRGQLFGRAGRSGTVVIDEAAAKALFAGEDPIGRYITWDRGRHSGTVVGIVGSIQRLSIDTRQSVWVRSSRPNLYSPLADGAGRLVGVLVRTPGDPARLAAPLRRAVAEVDADVPIDVLSPLRDVVSDQFARERFLVNLTAIFAAIALVLSAAGVYAVVAFTMVRRMPEMGLRVALGAQRLDLYLIGMRRGLVLALVGVGVGVAGAVAAAEAIQSLLFEVSPLDPLVFFSVALLLVIVTLLASYVPSRRAGHVDPVVALRME